MWGILVTSPIPSIDKKPLPPFIGTAFLGLRIQFHPKSAEAHNSLEDFKRDRENGLPIQVGFEQAMFAFELAGFSKEVLWWRRYKGIRYLPKLFLPAAMCELLTHAPLRARA